MAEERARGEAEGPETASLPPLEIPCRVCNGKMGRYLEDECWRCSGTGYEPTEAGDMVLDLMRRHLPRLMRELHDG